MTVAGRSLDWRALLGAAGAVAARVRGLPAVAVDANASLETVVAVVGGLAAGVPVVPVPPDAGPLERTHILSRLRRPRPSGRGRHRSPSAGRPEVVPVDAPRRRGLAAACRPPRPTVRP